MSAGSFDGGAELVRSRALLRGSVTIRFLAAGRPDHLPGGERGNNLVPVEAGTGRQRHDSPSAASRVSWIRGKSTLARTVATFARRLTPANAPASPGAGDRQRAVPWRPALGFPHPVAQTRKRRARASHPVPEQRVRRDSPAGLRAVERFRFGTSRDPPRRRLRLQEPSRQALPNRRRTAPVRKLNSSFRDRDRRDSDRPRPPGCRADASRSSSATPCRRRP